MYTDIFYTFFALQYCRGVILIEHDITLVPSAELFFYELFTACTSNQDVEVSDNAAHYVTTLLATRLVNLGNMGDNFGGTLVDLLRESLEDEEKRKELTQDLGETALVTAGIFYDHLLSRRVSADYYIHMGQLAYGTLSDLTRPPKSDVYNELAHKFSGIVLVLNEIADRTMIHTDKDITRTYAQWLETESEQLAKRLLRNGIPLQIRKEKNLA